MDAPEKAAPTRTVTAGIIATPLRTRATRIDVGHIAIEISRSKSGKTVVMALHIPSDVPVQVREL